MGSCVSSSVHKGTAITTTPAASSAMKLDLAFQSNNDKLVIPPSPIKEKPLNGEYPINDWSATTFKDFGSKEETFFDSQAWLDSDCDDDFHSVRGDFTPSRGNTPVHHNFFKGNKTLLVDRSPSSIPEPSPRKKLSELFQQSNEDGSEDQGADGQGTPGSQNMANPKTEAKPTIYDLALSTNGTPYVSGTNSVCGSSEWTANEDPIMEKEKPMKSMQCCLPSLISCRSFNGRRKKMSPAIPVNGKP